MDHPTTPNQIERPNVATLTKAQRDDLLFAFYKIQQLEPNDPDSFFCLAAIHGLGPEGQNDFYCHHRTVLFPSWHRPYLLAMEDALRRQLPEARQKDFALPFWDQTSDDSLTNGVPEIFLVDKVTIEHYGEVSNPLKNYTFQATVKNQHGPLAEAGQTTDRGFTWIQEPKLRAEIYKANMVASLKGFVAPALNRCLSTSAWGRFSTSSGDSRPSQSLESPHDSLHNSAGGSPFSPSNIDWNQWAPKPIPDATADLEQTEQWKGVNAVEPDLASRLSRQYTTNPLQRAFIWTQIFHMMLPAHTIALTYVEIAAFDPLFWFHHNNMERFFWQWQKNHPEATSFDTPSPPTGPWLAPPMRELELGEPLTIDTPLHPYKLTTKQVWDTKSLSYFYPPVPPESEALEAAAPPHVVTTFSMAGVSQKKTGLKTLIHVEDEHGRLLGSAFPFIRLDPSSCPNCKINPMVTLHVPILHRPDPPPAIIQPILAGALGVAIGSAVLDMVAPALDVWPPPFKVFVSGVEQG